MSKTAVYFPGIGYHCDKPLLYYSRDVAYEPGLAITRTIILEHAGQIDPVSKEGEGTTFTIRPPVLASS